MRWEDRLRWIRRAATQNLARLVVLWAAWGLLCSFVYRVQWGQYRKSRQDLAPLHQRIEEYGTLIFQIPNPEEKLKEMEGRMQRLTEQSMGENVIPRTVQRLAQAAAENKVAIASIGPRDDLKSNPVQVPEGVEKRFIEVQVRCEYQALGSFLGQVEKLPTPLTVDDLMIRSARPEEGSSGLVEATLVVGVYGLT